MNSHHYSDPILVLNLSTRPYNVLKKEGVKTINDLLSYPIENIPKLRNLGAKSIDEITNIINELNLYRLEIYSEVKEEKESKTFIASDGLKYLDIRIEDLSWRKIDCLTLDNYNAPLIYSNGDATIKIYTLNNCYQLEALDEPGERLLQMATSIDIISSSYKLIINQSKKHVDIEDRVQKSIEMIDKLNEIKLNTK